jgi:hypothetical protein
MVKLAGVPNTVVTVPLVNVVERKSNVSADADTVIALVATEAEIGWIVEVMLLVRAIVPVAAGSVAVKLLALFGDSMVNTPAPLALPVIAIELMCIP